MLCIMASTFQTGHKLMNAWDTLKFNVYSLPYYHIIIAQKGVSLTF